MKSKTGFSGFVARIAVPAWMLLTVMLFLSIFLWLSALGSNIPWVTTAEQITVSAGNILLLLILVLVRRERRADT